ncbi:MAG TPA: 3-hydroxyacyl-CoA dehydrogenase/enoyl-CoA hydratase family protein [Polyangiaceae bacterium]|nr:3-hydroxyacyl-CoA dehydrogenase/enoyl-CoA hydratase family protein [Polyangiaceae bacterium]
MTESIRTAAVIGAGVMGSAIAAHLAGAGVKTHLLDIVPPNLTDQEKAQPKARNRFADGGLEKALKAKPAPFYDPDAARLVKTGNLEDHLDRLGECDLVIEAIIEDLGIKQKLFEKIAPKLKSDVILASNTSGLSIAKMSAVLPAQLRPQFMVLHFFNPVRYMRLLEIAPGPETRPELIARMASFGEWLGKGIVYAKDTANFVANRIGVYAMMFTMRAMLEDGLSVEQVDKIVGRPMGRPKSAAFDTADIVGLDTFAHVAKNCAESLPNDEERAVFALPEVVQQLIAKGGLGRKSGGGFYKKVGKDIHVIDLKTLEYRPQEKVRFDSLGAVKNEEDPGKRLKILVNADDVAGRFAWKVLSRTLAYSARRLGEIADDVVNVDRAMRWGFNWDLGPFEAWDAIGVKESVARMEKDGIALPDWVKKLAEAGGSFYSGGAKEPRFVDYKTGEKRPVPFGPKELRIAALKEAGKVVKENFGASLVDLGDGALGVEVHTKMNTLDPDVIGMLSEAVDIAEKDFEAIVIGNDGEHFGAGANLMLIMMAAQQKAWDQVEKIIRGLQASLQKVRYARVPAVAAPFQYTLGGAAEVAMAADACQAHAETYMGLVEVGVGLIPAGGGCLRMVERFTDDAAKIKGVDLLPFIGEASLNIATAKVATSADEARKLRYLRQTDGISLNRAELLFAAKWRALGMARAGYRPPRPAVHSAVGYDAARTIGARIWAMVEGGYATDHDALIANKLAHILCGGYVAAGAEVGDQHYLDLECEAFLSLCGEQKTLDRIGHMLMNNKPLRN